MSPVPHFGVGHYAFRARDFPLIIAPLMTTPAVAGAITRAQK